MLNSMWRSALHTLKWLRNSEIELENSAQLKKSNKKQTCNSRELNQSQGDTLISIYDNGFTNNNDFNIICENNTDKPDKGTKKFDFLDGYRGSLALIVVICHSCQGPECSILQLCSQKYAVCGFFLLSSFLLTYRLLIDFYKEKSKILVVMQFFIRRFFRIYVIYALFAVLLLYGPKFFAGSSYGHYPPISQILSIGRPGVTHLWTIPSEIKYYFLIPIICAIFYYCRRFSPIFLAICLFWISYDQLFNAFDLSAEDIVSSSRHSNYLKNHFAVFFIGSALAMSYFLSERSQKIMKFFKRDKIQFIIKYLALIVGIYGLVYHTETLNSIIDYRYRSRPAVIWSISLYMTLLSSYTSMNPIIEFYKLSFLRSCGKFSFGIYLLHPAAIHFVATNEPYLSMFKLRVTSSIIGSYILGFLFYHLVEKHMVKLANYLCLKIESF